MYDAFWLGKHGDPLRQRGIEGTVRRATMREFGHAYGTHWFRHCFGTSAPLAAPHLRGAPAAVLGNSPAVAEKDYNQTNLTIVAEMYHEVLDLEYQEALQYINKIPDRRVE
jgi:site-specific recombinase XerC